MPAGRIEPGSPRPVSLSSAIEHTITYRMSRWRVLFLLLVSLVFTAGGYLMVRDGESWRGWLAFGCSTILSLVGLLVLVFRPTLKLTLDGMEFSAGRRRGRSFRWLEVYNITPMRNGNQQQEPAVRFSRVVVIPTPTWHLRNSKIVGVDEYIVTST